MEALITLLNEKASAQANRAQKMQKLLTNAKKDGKARKTDEYNAQRLAEVDLIWEDIRTTHKEIEALNVPQHAYTVTKYFDRAEKIYNETVYNLQNGKEITKQERHGGQKPSTKQQRDKKSDGERNYVTETSEKEAKRKAREKIFQDTIEEMFDQDDGTHEMIWYIIHQHLIEKEWQDYEECLPGKYKRGKIYSQLKQIYLDAWEHLKYRIEESPFTASQKSTNEVLIDHMFSQDDGTHERQWYEIYLSMITENWDATCDERMRFNPPNYFCHYIKYVQASDYLEMKIQLRDDKQRRSHLWYQPEEEEMPDIGPYFESSLAAPHYGGFHHSSTAPKDEVRKELVEMMVLALPVIDDIEASDAEEEDESPIKLSILEPLVYDDIKASYPEEEEAPIKLSILEPLVYDDIEVSDAEEDSCIDREENHSSTHKDEQESEEIGRSTQGMEQVTEEVCMSIENGGQSPEEACMNAQDDNQIPEEAHQSIQNDRYIPEEAWTNPPEASSPTDIVSCADSYGTTSETEGKLQGRSCITQAKDEVMVDTSGSSPSKHKASKRRRYTTLEAVVKTTNPQRNPRQMTSKRVTSKYWSLRIKGEAAGSSRNRARGHRQRVGPPTRSSIQHSYSSRGTQSSHSERGAQQTTIRNATCIHGIKCIYVKRGAQHYPRAISGHMERTVGHQRSSLNTKGNAANRRRQLQNPPSMRHLDTGQHQPIQGEMAELRPPDRPPNGSRQQPYCRRTTNGRQQQYCTLNLFRYYLPSWQYVKLRI